MAARGQDRGSSGSSSGGRARFGQRFAAQNPRHDLLRHASIHTVQTADGKGNCTRSWRSPATLPTRALFLSIQNNSQLALEFLEKAIELSPNHAESVYYKGYCLESLEREEEALRSYHTAIHLLEGSANRFSGPYEGMARLLLDEDIERALGWAQKAVQLQPELDANHLILAKVYERLGKLNQAVEELQETVRLNPSHTSAHYILFRLYKRLGHSEEAKSELSIFKKLKAVYGEQ